MTISLRALEIRLKFIEAADFPFFHQAVVTGWLRHLLGSPPEYERVITIDTPESGCIRYRRGDPYGFAIFVAPGGEEILRALFALLQTLPDSAARREAALPLRDNVVFEGAADLFTRRRIRHLAQLGVYDEQALNYEAAQWRHVKRCRLRWLAPVRLLLDKAERGGFSGEARFCRQGTEVPFELLYTRLGNTLGGLLGEEPPPAPAGPLLRSDVWWVQHSYRNANGRELPMGGLLGLLEFECADFTPAHWRWWVLGQYLGIGQRRVFGWGRYRLESDHGETTLLRTRRGNLLSRRALEAENLNLAYTESRRKSPPAPLFQRGEDNDTPLWKRGAGGDFEAAFCDDEDPEEEPVERLARLRKHLLDGTYAFPRLRGRVLEKPGHAPRALAVPPFFDRVAQRAVAQVITPALDALMQPGSFAYRQGRSRHGARDRIQRAYAEGRTWVYRADIEAFFDSVEWGYVHTRLRALFGEEDLVKWILRWLSAPVEYQGQEVKRRSGLPQGAPLSPVLANLLLDDFDSDMALAGFTLVRFADDFVVLGKSRAEAEDAGRTAAASLGHIGLRLNPAKTRICTFAQGFRFVGYIFMNSLALDAGGEKEPTQAPAPARGWLAEMENPPQSPFSKGGGDEVSSPLEKGEGFTKGRALEAEKSPASLHERRENAEKKPGNPPGLGQAGDAGMMLFVTGPPGLLATREERLYLERGDDSGEKNTLVDVPWEHLQAVVLFGAHHVTTPALKAAFRHRVPLHFASSGGHYQGVASAPLDDDLWLAQQLWLSDAGHALDAARSVVGARLRHQREVLRLRNVDTRLGEAVQALGELIKQVPAARDLSQLNGYEGQGGKVYFQALQHLVPAAFGFGGRNRRPPRDPFNALLSLGYTILYAHVETVCRACGLHPGVGFYHQPHGAHAVLASDLMEPFRHVVERTALTALNKRQLKTEDFFVDAEQGCRLTNPARKTYLTLLGEAFERPFQARGESEPATLHEHLRRQNYRLIAWLRGRADTFSAWRMR